MVTSSRRDVSAGAEPAGAGPSGRVSDDATGASGPAAQDPGGPPAALCARGTRMRTGRDCRYKSRVRRYGRTTSRTGPALESEKLSPPRPPGRQRPAPVFRSNILAHQERRPGGDVLAPRACLALIHSTTLRAQLPPLCIETVPDARGHRRPPFGPAPWEGPDKRTRF